MDELDKLIVKICKDTTDITTIKTVYKNSHLPDGCIFPDTLPINPPPGLTAEQYYELLFEFAKKQSKGGSGSGFGSPLDSHDKWDESEGELVHGTKYKYDKVVYTTSTTPVLIYCNYHKEYFSQKPSTHISGSGCQKCANLTAGGWGYSTWKKKADRSKHFTGFKLYVIECTDSTTQEKFIKIGKTYTSLEYRLKTMPYDWKLLYSIEDSDYKVICDFEKILHRQFRYFRYAPRLPFSGKTECFTPVLKQYLYSTYHKRPEQ